MQSRAHRQWVRRAARAGSKGGHEFGRACNAAHAMCVEREGVLLRKVPAMVAAGPAFTPERWGGGKREGKERRRIKQKLASTERSPQKGLVNERYNYRAGAICKANQQAPPRLGG